MLEFVLIGVIKILLLKLKMGVWFIVIDVVCLKVVVLMIGEMVMLLFLKDSFSCFLWIYVEIF